MKTFKRALSLVLALALALAMLQSVAFAEGEDNTNQVANSTITASGTCGDYMTWILESDGLLTISGTGTMTDYTNGYQPWYTMRNSIKKVVVDDGAISIGDNAFYDCSALTEVVLPDTISAIRSYAFYSCGNLSTINIPSSMDMIQDYAFAKCGLTSIKFLGDAVEIWETAFKNVIANAYYPTDNTTWTSDKMQSYGGTLTWITITPGTNTFSIYVSDLENSYKFMIYPATMTDAEIRADLATGSQVIREVVLDQKVTFEGLLEQSTTFEIAQGTYKFVEVITDSTDYCPDITEMDISQDGGLDCEGLRKYGDINGDGEFSVWDATLAYAALTGTKTLDDYSKACADLNNDGELTVWEVTQIYNKAIDG